MIKPLASQLSFVWSSSSERRCRHWSRSKSAHNTLGDAPSRVLQQLEILIASRENGGAIRSKLTTKSGTSDYDGDVRPVPLGPTHGECECCDLDTCEHPITLPRPMRGCMFGLPPSSPRPGKLFLMSARSIQAAHPNRLILFRLVTSRKQTRGSNKTSFQYAIQTRITICQTSP